MGWTVIDPHHIGSALIYHGDVLDVAEWMGLRKPKSVNCIVTSPPYYALRDYKLDPTDWPEVDYSPMPGLPALHIPAETSCHGLEATPEAYIAHEVLIWRLLREVLRDDGLAWINIGDGTEDGRRNMLRRMGRPVPDIGLQPLDWIGIPGRLQFALQADGWLLRMDNIWAKASPMPESVSGWRWQRHRVKVASGSIGRMGDPATSGHRTHGASDHPDIQQAKYTDCPGCPTCSPNDGLVLRRGAWRCTKSHEYILQLAKGPGYFADGIAVAESAECDRMRGPAEHPCEDTNGNDGLCRRPITGTRNPRSVWRLSSRGYGGQHYATFPVELPLKCIMASISEKGYCANCGKPWVRVVDREADMRGAGSGKTVGASDTVAAKRIWERSRALRAAGHDHDNPIPPVRTLGWRPSCDCRVSIHGQVHAPPDPVPGVVLDPFSGTATTGIACQQWGCEYIGIEKSEDYLQQSIERLAKGESMGMAPATADAPLFQEQGS